MEICKDSHTFLFINFMTISLLNVNKYPYLEPVIVVINAAFN